jgi:hypothetical protein
MENNIMKKVAEITALLTLIGMFFAVFFFVEKRYAQKDEIKRISLQLLLLDRRLELQINSDKMQSTQDRIWQLQDKFEENPDHPLAKVTNNEIRILEQELESFKDMEIKLFNQIQDIEEKIRHGQQK